MSGDSRVDNKKYKTVFGEKARMLGYDEVEEVTGHPAGGLCPFGLREDFDIYIDESIRGHEYVYPAAGSRYHAMKIAPALIEELTHASWIDVRK